MVNYFFQIRAFETAFHFFFRRNLYAAHFNAPNKRFEIRFRFLEYEKGHLRTIVFAPNFLFFT